MSSRRPAQRPFVVVLEQGGAERAALLTTWVHGRKGDPDAWLAEVVVHKFDLEGRAGWVKQLVSADNVRPATATDLQRRWTADPVPWRIGSGHSGQTSS